MPTVPADTPESSGVVPSPDALTPLRRVLDLAASEPEDRVAIHYGGGLSIANVTWAELRAVVDQAKAEAYRDLSDALIHQRDTLRGHSAYLGGRRVGLEDAARIARAAAVALGGTR